MVQLTTNSLQRSFYPSEQPPHWVHQRACLLGIKETLLVPSNGVYFGYFSHHQATLLEAKDSTYIKKTETKHLLTPLDQPAGSSSCGTRALAMVLNALKSQTPPQSSNDLDHHIRRWKNLGLTPQLMLDEARRQGLYAQAYNHGSVDDVRRHLALGHVIVVMHRARTQYHFELIKAIGENKNGEPLITVTDALGKPNNTPGYKTFLFKEFNRTCWQTLKIGVFGKGAKPDDPDARNAYLNIPTGHDCYYLAFSTQDDLAKPTKNQKGPWIDAPAAGANRWANRVAKALNKAMKLLGLKTLRSEWFGAFAT